MAAKEWWIGCGTLAVIGVVVVGVVLGYFAGRATEITQGIQHARDRYAESGREFPFNPPATGELSPERFAQYLKVREAVDTAMSPLRNNQGFVFSLSTLTSLPEEVSRIHVDALRGQSMSIDEYRWISRQIYTTVAGEAKRAEADPELRDLQRSLEAALRRGNGIQVQTNASRNLFDAGLIDLTWLKVPDATRAIVRQHAREIANMPNAVIADPILLNMG